MVGNDGSFCGEELFEKGNDLGVLFVEGFGNMAGNGGNGGTDGVGGSGMGGGGMGFARGEAEPGVGLFSASSRLVKDGAIYFGDQNVVVVVGV